jgi:hypothetical protein
MVPCERTGRLSPSTKMLGRPVSGKPEEGVVWLYILLSATSFEQHGWRLGPLALFPEALPLPS